MTEEEIQEQVELMQKTLDEQKAALALKDTAMAELQKKLDAGVKDGPTEDELKALKLKAEKHDELDKKVKTLEGELTVTRLKAKHPDVDFSVIQAGSEAEMDAQAAKISAMIAAAVKKAAPQGAGNAGNQGGGRDQGYQWDGRGQGALTPDAKSRAEKAKENLTLAMKDGGGKEVLDACFDSQPGGTARLFDGLYVKK